MRPEFLAALGLLLREGIELSRQAKGSPEPFCEHPDLAEAVAEEVVAKVGDTVATRALTVAFLLGLLLVQRTA